MVNTSKLSSKMKQRVFVIHGWGGSPQKDWFPWIAKTLERKGYEAVITAMPNTNNPVIDEWVSHLEKTVVKVQSDDIFIGHSIGNQTIWRYLEQLSENEKIEKVIMIVPWITLTNLENEESWKIADPWLKTPINFEKVQSKTCSFVALFSTNDQWVPLEENETILEEKLHAQCVVLKDKGHFTADEGVTEIPEVLKYL